MNLLVISYDLRKPDRDYQSLYDEFAKQGAIRVLQSVFCLRSNASAVDVREHFKRFVDANDGLFVATATDWASFGTHSSPNDLAHR